MEPLATAQDVIERWRPLYPAEESVVDALLDDASDMVRVRWPDIDDRIAAGAVRTATSMRIVAGMVRRAMMNRGNEGVAQQSQGAGPFTQSATFSNPSNNLYLSADDIRALDPAGYYPRAKVAWLA